jgi:hypothetical protein
VICGIKTQTLLKKWYESVSKQFIFLSMSEFFATRAKTSNPNGYENL